MDTYDAVVLSYLRPDAVRECVEALRAQTPPPARIVVWHNAPSRVALPGAVNIFCDENLKCRARHAAAMLSAANICVFIDDDVILKSSEVCAKLVAGVLRHPCSVVGHEARRCLRVSDSMYWGQDSCRRTGVEAPVSVVKGKLHAVRRVLLHHAFSRDLPEDVWTEDDIVLNASVQMATGQPSWTIEGIGRADFVNLTDDLGNETREDHWARRNAACRWMVEEGWNPVLWRDREGK